MLRGVNDNIDLLESLSRHLYHAGVLPYDLPVMDPVRGAAHFDVPDTETVSLVEALQSRLPGYRLPGLLR